MLKSIKLSKRNQVWNPWITLGVINSIGHRDYLYKNEKKSIPKTYHFGDLSL